MELREFAEQVLFAKTLEQKLPCPVTITDDHPGPALAVPEVPGRPAELRFKPPHSGKTNIPGLHSLERQSERGRLLHFFANHELLATELMALALLRFPDAPPAFRRGVLQTLKDEQQHTRLYLNRMEECGIHFGEMPVSGYFWRAISSMQTPIEFVAGLSLTFEQANLDFARHFSRGFAQLGDERTARLLDRIYHDEIAHVAHGLKWFRKWKSPEQSDWEAYCGLLRFPLSAQRAKGPVFNVEGRLAAGLEPGFIEALKVYAQSKGRTPRVFLFNPFAEGRIAHGKSFTPNKLQRQLQQDLETLPLFLCRRDDVVLVERRPSASFLGAVKQSGYPLPEFVELNARGIDPSSNLPTRRIGGLCPWAWGPDSVEVLQPLFGNLAQCEKKTQACFNQSVANLYSKAWSAGLLRKFLARPQQNSAAKNSTDRNRDLVELCDTASWLCSENEVGVAVETVQDAMSLIEAIRCRGHQEVVVKEALGLAGRNAIRLLEPELLENQKRWLANVVKRGGRLVIEPWLDRQLDFSVQLEMKATGLELLGYTGLLNDHNGQFRGNWAWPNYPRRIPASLSTWFPAKVDFPRRMRALYTDILSLLEEEFRLAGYRGPAGIDAFIYRAPEGEYRLKPIVEINPRYTMGRLTLELMKQVAPGAGGQLRLTNLAMVKTAGYENFVSWAQTMRERFSLRLEGEPVPRIHEGIVFLNDPERAQVCLATFQVGKASVRVME